MADAPACHSRGAGIKTGVHRGGGRAARRVAVRITQDHGADRSAHGADGIGRAGRVPVDTGVALVGDGRSSGPVAPRRDAAADRRPSRPALSRSHHRARLSLFLLRADGSSHSRAVTGA